MQTNLATTKTILARLLAGENLTVQHSNVPTAYIDLNTRTIHCPIWTDMDGAVYDLLMGHEVSHALHTPYDGWHSNVSEHGQGFKSVLNVVEDARIEKKIKRKYPGLSKSFAAAYASLYERDFFGIKNFKDLSKLNLADRINLYFKLGHLMYVPFSDDERVIVNEVANLDTWEQVVDVSHRIYGVMKENKDDTITNPADFDLERQEQEQQDDDGDNIESEFDPLDNSEESEDADWADGSSPVSNQENGSDEESSTSSPTSGGSGLTDDVESVTDRIFRNREHELVVSSDDWVVNMELPTPKLDKIVMPFKYVMNGWTGIRAAVNRQHDAAPNIFATASQMIESANSTFRAKNNSVINSLVKEFEMRKNASRYARQKTARSGDLDMNRLHNYKLSNDIFKRMTIVPNGKSHGMMMIVDFSGSMCNIMEETVEQIMILATFCRRVNIPFDVYGFCDDVRGTEMQRKWFKNRESNRGDHWTDPGYTSPLWNYDKSQIQMTEEHFHLKHLIGSSMSKGDYAVASEMLTTFAYYFNQLYYGYGYAKPNQVKVSMRSERNSASLVEYGFGLGGTPLVEAILATRSMIERFKAANRLDVVNVIHLTDGCGGGAWSYQSPPSDQSRYWSSPKVVYITDPITKRRITVTHETHNCQAAITAFVRELTGCKHIGYYMVGGKYSRQGLSRFVPVTSTVSDDMWNSWRNDGFIAVESLGFDSYFYMNVKPINDEFKVEDGASKTVLKKSFAKYMNGKRSNRALTVRFAKEIAA